MSKIGEALFTTTQRELLKLLYGQTERSFYTKELLKLTGMGVATIKRELDRMTAAGLLTLTKIGNQHHYQANPECPIFDELMAIVRKTFGHAEVVRRALDGVLEQIDLAFIYGSVAKNSDSAKSDLDLLVITETLAYADLMEHLLVAEKELGRAINPSVYNKAQFILRIEQQNAFVTRIMEQPKIMIRGELEDFASTR